MRIKRGVNAVKKRRKILKQAKDTSVERASSIALLAKPL